MTGEQTPSGTMLVFFGNAVSLSKLAGTLQGMVQRPIIDKTNVKGLFDFRIRFSPSLMPAFPEQTRPEDGQLIAPSDHPLLPIIQDELGLKLEPGKGSVEVLVIDSAQKPSEN